ncbi:MAG: alginate export family protein, partial [Myxococcales bacterium]|nr:alginate export family protein [Myxococcales bacterium]
MRRVGAGAGLIIWAWAAGATAQVAPPAPETLAVGDFQLAPVLEVRVRGEYRHDLDGQDRSFLTERARVGLDAQRGWARARVVVQDVHLWDLAGGTDTAWEPQAQALLGAYEAWGEVQSSAFRPAYLRVGRQPITWGEGRLLGVADWSPTGRTLDAVRGRVPVGDGAFEILAASLSDPPGGSLVAWGELFGARAEWRYHPLFAVEGYALARIAHVHQIDLSGKGQTYTGALRLHGESSAWTWGLEGAYQLGRTEDVRGGLPRSAWAAAAHVAYTFERVLWQPTARLGGSYASGDDGSGTYHAFDPIFPDTHVWHGAMDVFAWSNQIEVNGRVSAVPWTDAVVA